MIFVKINIWKNVIMAENNAESVVEGVVDLDD